ncbi:MAG: DEAD/DEAH box helicase, partial [Myxococcota bacterium]
MAGNRPQVHPWLQVPTKSGGLGKARRTKPDKLLDSDYAIDADDQHVAELLELYQLMHDPTSARASRILQRILQNLVGHPRVLRQPDGVPFAVRRAELTLVTVRGEGNVRLLPSVDDEIWTLEDFAKRFQRRVGRLMTYTTEDALILVEVPPAFASVVEVLHQHDFQMPERALPELVKRLPRFAPRVPVTFDREVPRVSVSARRHLVVRLSPRGSGLTATVAIQPMTDGPVHVPGEGPAEVLHVNEEGQLQATLRDRGAEITWAKTRVQALMPDADADHRPWRYALSTPEDALTTLERLQAAEDVSVQWPSRHPWKISSATANGRGLRIEVRDRPDWFGIGGDIDVDGQRVPLNNLIDAIQRNDSFVEVQQGQWAKIGEDLRQRLRDLEPHLRREKDELAVTPAAAEALESLGTASAEFVRSVRWKANLDRLEAAKSADDTPPPDLKATLRDYQLAGFRWMNRLATWGLGACLADDMGLGKTLQALAILAARATQGPQLVVAPTSVVYNWVREAERFAPSLDIRLYIGSDRSEILDDLGPQTLIVTSYGLVVRDVQTLSSLALTTVVLDEAQAIKNAQSQRSIAVRQLQADWKLALSGTPVENHLGELWSLFDAIAPGLLGSWTNFRDRFVAPIERDGNRARAEALSRLLRPFVLRRTKQEVAKELPARTSINLDIVLTDAERAVYDQARTTAVAELAGASSDGRGRFAALAALTRLRQLACHPRLVDPSSELPSSKLGRLMTLVRALRTTKQRALLFSQFTQHLALVREALEEAGFNYLYLDGQTPVEE